MVVYTFWPSVPPLLRDECPSKTLLVLSCHTYDLLFTILPLLTYELLGCLLYFSRSRLRDLTRCRSDRGLHDAIERISQIRAEVPNLSVWSSWRTYRSRRVYPDNSNKAYSQFTDPLKMA